MNYRVRAQVVNKTIIIAIVLVLTLPAITRAVSAPPKLLPLRVRVGEKAPDFSLPSTGGHQVQLSSFLGHTVLLDFYEGYW